MSYAAIIRRSSHIHRKKQLKEMAAKDGKQIIFLPPYSPELTPIEHFGNWLKRKIPECIHKCKNLDEAIDNTFKVW